MLTRVENGYYEIITAGRPRWNRSIMTCTHLDCIIMGDCLIIIISQIAFQNYWYKLSFLLIFANKIHIISTRFFFLIFIRHKRDFLQITKRKIPPTCPHDNKSHVRSYIHDHRETNGVDRRRHNRYYGDRNERGTTRAGVIFR